MTDERLAETTWRCAPGCRADNDAGLHKPECERPAETTEELVQRIRAGITAPEHAGSDFMASLSNDALAALGVLRARLDAVTKQNVELRSLLDKIGMEAAGTAGKLSAAETRFNAVTKERDEAKQRAAQANYNWKEAESDFEAAEADAEALAQALEVIRSWRDPEAMREHARAALDGRSKS